MADAESVYLPALEPCLVGRIILLSWQRAYQALRRDVVRLHKQQHENPLEASALDFEWDHDLLSFLSDANARNLLRGALDAFPIPTKESQAAFDTRTSAINVTDPGRNGPYDIQRIKNDAIWLSKEAQIEESAALRIVILEWQSRASRRLLHTGTKVNPESASRSGLGASFRQSSFLGSAKRSHISFLDSSADQDFDSETGRKCRLLEIFLEERLHLVRVGALLIQMYCEHLPVASEPQYTGILTVARSIVTKICSHDMSEAHRVTALDHVVDALQRRVRCLEKGSGWFTEQWGHADVELMWDQTQTDEIIALLKMIYAVLARTSANSTSITTFINLVLSRGLLELQLPRVSTQSQDTVKLLSAVVLARFFQPPTSSNILLAVSAKSSSAPLWTKNDVMNEINNAMLELATRPGVLASIPIYAWALYVQRSKADGAPQTSDTPATYDDTANLQLLGNAAVNEMHLFDNISQLAISLPELMDSSGEDILETRIRESLLEMLAYSVNNGLVGYEPEAVEAVLSLIDADRSYWKPASMRAMHTTIPDHVITNYLAPWLELAQSRFPLEAAPLLRLVKALLFSGHSSAAAYKAFAKIFNSTITGFTEQLNQDFASYDEADVDPSKGYFIELQADLPLFISRLQAAHTHAGNNDRALVLASQSNWQPLAVMGRSTVGEVLGDQTRPLIVDWNWTFNPLDYVIDWLASAKPGSQHVLFSSLAVPTDDECNDIIGLCNSILHSLRHADQREVDVESVIKALLDTTSRGFEDETDLIATVFDIFEYQIQLHRQQSSQNGSSELLTQCTQFIHAISYYRPSRIWPFLARSQLLDLSTNDPALVAIVTNSEMVQGCYDFLHSCVKLFERLVDLAIVHEATKPVNKASTTALTRFAHEAGARRAQYIPAKAVKNIMSGYIRIAVSVFANREFWPFKSRSQRAAINIAILQSFQKILHATYGFAQPEEKTSRGDSILQDCASILLNLALDSGSSEGLIEPILSVLHSPLPTQLHGPSSIYDHLEQEKAEAIDFCSIVLRVAIHTHHHKSILEQRLFVAAPQLAKTYAYTTRLQIAIARLMVTLLTAASKHGEQPLSLLGHMGADIAKSFLTLLTRQNMPCMSEQEKIDVWKLLTTVVSSQQQWFALYLLTGKTPRESSSSENNNSSGCTSQAIINYALDELSNTFSVVPSAAESGLKVAVAMLNFVAQSCNYWPSAVGRMRQHPKFVPALTDYFSKLGRFDVTVGSMTWHTALGAGIAEILTIHLHTARQAGDVRPALSLINKLGYVKNFAFKPPQYNNALQSLLKRNVSSLFGNLNVSQFQHSTAFPVEHGRNFFYDVPTAMAMIHAARQASGRQSSSQSFLKDFEHTNLDLSKIDVQLELHQNSKLLVIEVSNALIKDTNLELMEPLLDILGDVLSNMNVDNSLPSIISERLSQSQVGLALTLLQRLVAVKTPAKLTEIMDQFPLIWSAVSSMLASIDDSLDNDGLGTRRKLLQILFLGIQPLTRWTGTEPNLKASARATVINRLPSSTYTQLLEITSEVIAKGFKSLASSIHDDSTSCAPSDFALLTAMLQTILTIPGIETIHSAMVLQLQNAEVSRYASSLFSWADQLLLNGDPIYGEHSILFLLELSTISSMAEILAVDGILAQLSAANLMSLFARKQGAGPFDDPPRAHSIWARGILPLCLNLLSAVGGPVAAEVVSFLLQSSPQIARVGRELANTNSPVGTRPGDTHITLTTAAELHTLALLTAAIDTLRFAGGADVPPTLPLDVWDPKSIAEDVDEWLAARTTRRDWIVPVNERHAALMSLKPLDASSRCESRLEERIWAELQGAKDCLSLAAGGGGVDGA